MNKLKYLNYTSNFLIIAVILLSLIKLSHYNSFIDIEIGKHYQFIIESQTYDNNLWFIPFLLYPFLLLNTLFFNYVLKYKESIKTYKNTNNCIGVLGIYVFIIFNSYSLLTIFSLIFLFTINELILCKRFSQKFNIIPLFCWLNIFIMLFLYYHAKILFSQHSLSTYLMTSIWLFWIKEIIINALFFITFYKISVLTANKITNSIVLYLYIAIPLLIINNLLFNYYLFNCIPYKYFPSTLMFW